MQRKISQLLRVTGTVTAGAAALAWSAYRRDITAAKKRIRAERQIIDTPHGPIEFAESGDGPAVLIIHGAGGGFDQGLDLGRTFAAGGFRIIAPSRFGYLGTPLPADASAEAQADAYLRLLDALQLEQVPVIGVSAGGPSAMQFCLRHPERCASLVLIVAATYAPNGGIGKREISPFVRRVLNAISASDFLFWTAMKVAHATLVQTILGTPLSDYRNATAEQRASVDGVLRNILPISRRAAGLSNDAVVTSSLERYKLEEIHVPTLVISAANDLYRTYEGGLYTAEQIHHGQFIGYRTGGHLLLGHEEEVRAHVTRFLRMPEETERIRSAG
jgi:pimeloyl-ACP methyl ester carboxylesterase